MKLQIYPLDVALFVSLALSSCSNSDTTRDSQQRVPAYGEQAYAPARPDTGGISIGDSVAVSVWDAPQFNTRALVKSNGSITLPLIGELKVAGYSKEEVVRILRLRFSEYIKGEVLFSVEIMKPPSWIYVFGMVGRQGGLPITSQLSLVDALLMAGGWSESADLRYVKITHPSTGGSTIRSDEFDLTTLLETGDMYGMPLVRPGDIVIVPKKENYILEFAGYVTAIFTLFGFFYIIR